MRVPGHPSAPAVARRFAMSVAAVVGPVALVVTGALACHAASARAILAVATTFAPTPSVITAPSPTVEAPVITGQRGVDLRIVDKQHALPADDVPPDLVDLADGWVAPGYAPVALRADAVVALTRLLRSARDAGIELRARSGYRSYQTQRATFDYWVALHGEAQARRESAEAGHSEHQLGTAVDLTSAAVDWDLTPAFGATRGGLWLAARAWEFGFALSYPDGAEAITGYEYEPWHIRYIGRTQAAGLHLTGLTLTEYLARLHAEDGPAPYAAPAPAASASPSPTPTPTPVQATTEPGADAGADTGASP